MDNKRISLGDFPEWEKAGKKYAQITEDLDLIRKKIHNRQVKNDTFSNADRLYSEALLLVEEVPETPPSHQEELLATLLGREHVLRTAQAIQSRKMAEIRNHISGEICREIKPQYDEIVKRLIETAIALQGIACEEREFQDMLFQERLECSCRITRISLGISNFDEKISSLIAVAKKNNYIT